MYQAALTDVKNLANSVVINWLEKHMIPCLFKQLSGFDCPGCGFQRSLIALMKGNITNSLKLYPATIPVIVTCIFLIAGYMYKIPKYKPIKKGLLFSVTAIITISYIIKIWGLYYHTTGA